MTKMLRRWLDPGRLYTHRIGPWRYIRRRMRCAFTHHEWRLNSGNPACSRCWKRMERQDG